MSETHTVRIAKESALRVAEIAAAAGVPQRIVIDKLVTHYGEAVQRMLTTPVQVESARSS